MRKKRRRGRRGQEDLVLGRINTMTTFEEIILLW